jgi:aminobenzoyl-glutamate transport protein
MNATRSITSTVLDWIERVGNRLPDPVTLFAIGAFAVLFGSHIAVHFQWTVTNPTTGADEVAKSLITPEGLRWVWLHLVSNFTGFAPLGVVLVGMIGIGVAEHTGLVGALLKGIVQITPSQLITPAIIFVGVMSSMAADAGYIVLPPLAAAVFMRSGRSPVVGLCAVFAGVAAGFSANLLITALDPLLQSFTQEAAQILNPDYQVDIRCNYYFMIASTLLVTLVGWGVTSWVIEPRYSPEVVAEQIRYVTRNDPDASSAEEQGLNSREVLGLVVAAISLLIAGGLVVYQIVHPEGALHGQEERRPGVFMNVWVEAIVPILFVLFLIPGVAYGITVGTVRSDRDIAMMMGKTMSSMGPYIVLAFFAAQFVSWFNESNLGRLIALEGVAMLQRMALPTPLLVLAIILLTTVLNLFIGSASAKWALLSTVFVPVFAGVGISPELTQAAYRVGDSVTNSIAPLNPYMVIVLVFMQRLQPRTGLGSLISMMLPYTIAFLLAWSVLLMFWMAFDLPLGPGNSPLFIEPLAPPATEG